MPDTRTRAPPISIAAADTAADAAGEATSEIIVTASSLGLAVWASKLRSSARS